MQLPENVLFCIDRLEQVGYPTYAVGGCVRDWLLGLAPHDYDLCTAATPEKIVEIFADFPLVRSGEKHGTVGVVLEHEVYEITTFRTEGTYTDSRHPDWVAFVSRIEEDLSRRDFTINAMAYSPARGLIDPFGGQADLQNHILRAVGDPERRFAEDALRILRGVRFAVRYGLTPEENTEKAMASTAPLMEKLAAERIFDELCKLLPLVKAEDLLRFAPILTQVLPEIKPCVGFDQHNPHHIHDVFTHTAQVVERVSRELPLRWAALLHDAGKPDTFTLDENGIGHFYGHAARSAEIADAVLLRLKAPTALRKNAAQLIALHMMPLEPDKKLLRRRLSQHDKAFVLQLLELQKADFGGKGHKDTAFFAQIQQLLQEILAENACLSLKDLVVNGHDLMALGYTGPQIGAQLNKLLQLVLEEAAANDRQALLQILKEETL